MKVTEYPVVIVQSGPGLNERIETSIFAETSAKALVEARSELVLDPRAIGYSIKVVPKKNI